MLFKKKTKNKTTPTNQRGRADDAAGDVNRGRPDRRVQIADRRIAGEVQLTLALRAVVGHVTLTRSEVTAWFVLKPHSTSWRDHTELETRIIDGATSLSRLGSCRTQLRVTSRPLSVRAWAEQTYRDAKRAGTPLPGFREMLLREQRRMGRMQLTEKLAFVGVRVAERRRHPYDPRREVRGLADRLAEIADHMEGPGLEALPATPEQMEILLRRSAALGAPAPRLDTIVPGDWEVSDLPQLEQQAEVTAAPYAGTARMRYVTDSGDMITKHVAVLELGKVGRLNVPQDNMGGWMQRADLLGFPVEWNVTLDLLDPADARGTLRHQMDVIQDQYEHYTEEHQIPAPELLKQQHTMARAAEHELDAGLTGENTRTQGWVHLAVWGDTREEALRKVAAVRKLYGQQMEWWHQSGGQHKLVRGFIPGEPLADISQRRRFVLPSFMAAMPAATAQIGDGYGASLGATNGVSRVGVSLALWRDMEDKSRERSGLMIVGGGLGSGKTYFCGGLVYRTAMAGVMWSVLDPSGRLGALADVPELRDYARYYDLAKGQGGELSPYLVVAEPNRDHYDDSFKGEAEYQNAVSEARGRRQDLMKDALMAWLPQSYQKDQRVSSILARATRAVPAEVTTEAAEVLARIEAIATNQAEDDLGDRYSDYRILANDILQEINPDSHRGRLIFGHSDQAMQGDHLLEIYGLQGISMPTAEQLAAGHVESDTRIAIALFSLAAWKVQARTFQADPNLRKGLFFDEGHLLAQFPTGPGLMAKASVDSRKHNTRAIFSSQNVSHFDLKNLSNLAGMVAIGKTTDEQESGSGAKALTLLGLPDDNPRYLRALRNLSRPPKPKKCPLCGAAPIEPCRKRGCPGRPHFREFVISTKDDTGTDSVIEQVIFDMLAHPHVNQALNTTPGQNRAEHTDDEGAVA